MNRIIIFVLLINTSFISCSKSDEDPSLPEATQTGANTAGCLVDGKILVPKGSSLGGPTLSAFYQEDENGFHFSISITDMNTEPIKGITVSTNGMPLVSGSSVELKSFQFDDQNNFISNHAFYSLGGGLFGRYVTTAQNPGHLIIEYLDESRKIIAGSFRFDAVNEDGAIIKITEGRFDVRYVN